MTEREAAGVSGYVEGFSAGYEAARVFYIRRVRALTAELEALHIELDQLRTPTPPTPPSSPFQADAEARSAQAS